MVKKKKDFVEENLDKCILNGKKLEREGHKENNLVRMGLGSKQVQDCRDVKKRWKKHKKEHGIKF